jgi:hypothetical protein
MLKMFFPGRAVSLYEALEMFASRDLEPSCVLGITLKVSSGLVPITHVRNPSYSRGRIKRIVI